MYAKILQLLVTWRGGGHCFLKQLRWEIISVPQEYKKQSSFFSASQNKSTLCISFHAKWIKTFAFSANYDTSQKLFPNIWSPIGRFSCIQVLTIYSCMNMDKKGKKMQPHEIFVASISGCQLWSATSGFCTVDIIWDDIKWFRSLR
jgi:hypothetical protein